LEPSEVLAKPAIAIALRRAIAKRRCLERQYGLIEIAMIAWLAVIDFRARSRNRNDTSTFEVRRGVAGMKKFKRSAMVRHPDDGRLTLAGVLTPGILPIWLLRKRVVSPQIGQAGVAGPVPDRARDLSVGRDDPSKTNP